MDEFLSVPDIAEKLALSKKTIYELIKQGKIKHIKAGHTIKVPKSCLRDYLRGNSNMNEKDFNLVMDRLST